MHYVTKLLRSSDDADGEDDWNSFTVQSYITIPLAKRKELKMCANKEKIRGDEIVARLKKPHEIIGSRKIRITDTTLIETFYVK